MCVFLNPAMTRAFTLFSLVVSLACCVASGSCVELSTRVPGSSSRADMRAACYELGGVSYGSGGEFCAVRGNYIQLSTRLNGASSWINMRSACYELGGVSYGSSGEFCAVRGNYVQLGSSGTNMRAACYELGGVSYGSAGESSGGLRRSRRIGGNDTPVTVEMAHGPQQVERALYIGGGHHHQRRRRPYKPPGSSRWRAPLPWLQC
jgi:hypothetical protein